jgi:hypothetical protein
VIAPADHKKSTGNAKHRKTSRNEMFDVFLRANEDSTFSIWAHMPGRMEGFVFIVPLSFVILILHLSRRCAQDQHAAGTGAP